MFPVETARLARDLLTAAGARLVYRELEDLSHTYPARRESEDPRLAGYVGGGPEMAPHTPQRSERPGEPWRSSTPQRSDPGEAVALLYPSVRRLRRVRALR